MTFQDLSVDSSSSWSEESSDSDYLSEAARLKIHNRFIYQSFTDFASDEWRFNCGKPC